MPNKELLEEIYNNAINYLICNIAGIINKHNKSVIRIEKYTKKIPFKKIFFLQFNTKITILNIIIDESCYIAEILCGKPKIKDIIKSNVDIINILQKIDYDRLEITYK